MRLSYLPCVRNTLLIGLALLSFIRPVRAATEPLTIPVFVKYALMQQIMLQQMFKGPGQTAVYPLDKTGCATVNFAKPHLSSVDNLLQVRANVLVKMGVPLPNNPKKCIGAKKWSGRTVVQGKPVITGQDSLTVHFQVVNAEVFNANGTQFNNALVSAALEGQLHPLLDQFKINLKPQLRQLESVLPFMLPGYSDAQINELIDSVHLGKIEVQRDGLNIAIQMAVDKNSMLKFLPSKP